MWLLFIILVLLYSALMMISKETIVDSIIEYNNHSLPILRAALGSRPIYFPCVEIGDETLFCLSKFCQFVGATLPNYVASLRRSAKGGGEVQQMITKELGQPWMKYQDAPENLKHSFKSWMNMVNPRYQIENAKFIMLSNKTIISSNGKRNIRKQTSNDLEEVLLLKKEIGAIGEIIALEYEVNRLKALDCEQPKNHIEHISPVDVGAGYDILSNYNGKSRFIEVKATIGDGNNFYITSNELNVLRNAQEESFIYVVRITDLQNRIGYVDREINNPVSVIEPLDPILFKFTL